MLGTTRWLGIGFAAGSAILAGLAVYRPGTPSLSLAVVGLVLLILGVILFLASIRPARASGPYLQALREPAVSLAILLHIVWAFPLDWGGIAAFYWPIPSMAAVGGVSEYVFLLLAAVATLLLGREAQSRGMFARGPAWALLWAPLLFAVPPVLIASFSVHLAVVLGRGYGV